MKKLLGIIFLVLLGCNISLAQEFYPNKELDIDKLINFDLNKYRFTDYKKIIGVKKLKYNKIYGRSVLTIKNITQI